MRVVDIEKGDVSLEDVLSLATEEDIILTRAGRVCARLEKFSDEDWEDWLFEHDPKVMQAADEARGRRSRGEGMTLGEVRAELGA